TVGVHSFANDTLAISNTLLNAVKITGSDINTRLDSLFIEAAMTSEFTATERLRPLASWPSFIVAFSVLRNCPRFL
uniref:Uncharacterized protein n=2 Tax=Sinocyclocheilus TaxID=75365 RepID=A0A673H8J3_9TELE